MNIPFCKVTTSKADYGNKRIRIGFEMTYNEDNKELAERLAAYIGKDAQAVELRIIPIQPPLFAARSETPDPQPPDLITPTAPEDWTPADGTEDDI